MPSISSIPFLMVYACGNYLLILSTGSSCLRFHDPQISRGSYPRPPIPSSQNRWHPLLHCPCLCPSSLVICLLCSMLSAAILFNRNPSFARIHPASILSVAVPDVCCFRAIMSPRRPGVPGQSCRWLSNRACDIYPERTLVRRCT